LVVVLVLSSAAVGALALVLMRKATAGEPAFSVALLRSLVCRPVWLAGVAAMVVEFVLQLLALAGGPVSLVQLLVVMELPFCLLLSRLVLGGRLAAREWSAVGALTVGVVVLLVTLAPHGGRADSLGLITWLKFPAWHAIPAAVNLGLDAVCLHTGTLGLGLAQPPSLPCMPRTQRVPRRMAANFSRSNSVLTRFNAIRTMAVSSTSG